MSNKTVSEKYKYLYDVCAKFSAELGREGEVPVNAHSVFGCDLMAALWDIEESMRHSVLDDEEKDFKEMISAHQRANIRGFIEQQRNEYISGNMPVPSWLENEYQTRFRRFLK